MAVRRAKAKMNIPMCVACVLFCLTLFSFYLTGGLFARYITNNEGKDSARVIKFGDITITETGDFTAKDGKNNFIVIPGVGLTKDVELAFTGSEAATYVFVEIATEYIKAADNYTFTYESNGKTMLQWSVVEKTEGNPDGWTYLTTKTATTEGKDINTHVYYRELAPNTSISDVDIISGGTINVNAETRSDIESLKNKDISIEIRASAVQAGGFASATAAWTSISAKGE